MQPLRRSWFRRTAPIVLMAAALPAQTQVIRFEEPGLVAMANTPGAVVPTAARLSTQFVGTLGARFESAGGFVAVVNHGSLTPSIPNVIGGVSASGGLSYMQPITVRFVDPADPTQPATTDSFRIRGDLNELNTGTGTVQAYAVDGTLLGSQTLPDNAPGMVFTLAIASPGIHRVVISQSTGTVGWDNVEFLPVRRAAAYVPYGVGCAGSLGVPVLANVPGSLPIPGTTFSATIGNAATGVALMATGLSDAQSGGIPLPLPLAAVGMPGCQLFAETLQFDAIVGAGTLVGWSWPVPAGAALLGLRFYQQGFTLDPAANAFGFVASNAAAATIGS